MTIIDQPQAPIDPAVERSRAVVDALGRLAVIITNHPELAPALKVEATVHCFEGVPDFDAAAAAAALGGTVEHIDGANYRYLRCHVTLAPTVTIEVWQKAGPCPECGR